MTEALAIFLKPPQAGRVKTRLQPLLGPEQASRLYAAFLADTVALARSLQDVQVSLWVAGDPDDPRLRAIPGVDTLPRHAQVEGDLGARMQAALCHALRDHARAVVIGSDAPSLPPLYVRSALQALQARDAVLGPSVDGGYYLVGSSRAVEGLFDGVRWSSAHTFDDTWRAAQRARIHVDRIAPWYDVDTPADLELLRMHLRLKPRAAPATARVLGIERDPGLRAR